MDKSWGPLQNGISVDAGFPGGNIRVVGQHGHVIRVQQDLRDTEGHWFYWYFRVRGAAGRVLRFEFEDRNAVGVRGPAVSRDGGETWAWGWPEPGVSTGFEFEFGPDDHEVRFAMSMPYVLEHLDRWWERVRPVSGVGLDRSVLCLSRAGSGVPVFQVGRPSALHSVLVTARHHCCEAMASYAMEGLLEAVQADPWFGAHTCLRAVPLVDLDGVQSGDQGKNRRPHDHNRDYTDRPIYPETRAIQSLVRDWPGSGLGVWLDLHCPWIRGTDCNQMVYQVGSRTPKVWAEQRRLARHLEAAQAGGVLPYRASDDLPFGERWNVTGNEGGLCKSTRWGVEQAGLSLASAIEVPYADAHGVTVTADVVRELGSHIAEALKGYLAETGPRGQG